LDIPIQHISDTVLNSMGRGISSQRIKELLFKLREEISNLVLRTTLLVGYPNETENEFIELCDFIREIKFEKLGVFTYSHEEETKSYLLKNRITQKEKERRKDFLMEIQREISFEKNQKLIGTKLKVIIDDIENEYAVGRSERDAPEADGEVLLKNNKLIIGNFYNVEVFDCNEYDLFAKFPITK